MFIDGATENRLASQRVSARGSLGVRLCGGRSRVHRLFQEGAAKIRLPATHAPHLEAVLINTAGGMTGGDRLAWDIAVEAGASAVLTTQACEKAYRSNAGRAEVTVLLKADAGASLAWLPQETIVFDRANFSRRLEADIAPDARLLCVEATVFGRAAMGETVMRGLFCDRWTIGVAGRPVHAEAFSIGPEIAAQLSRACVAQGGAAFATVLLVAADAEHHLASARSLLGESGGASFWTVGNTGKLLARIVATDGYALRRKLVPLIELLNDWAPLPKVWSL